MKEYLGSVPSKEEPTARDSADGKSILTAEELRYIQALFSACEHEGSGSPEFGLLCSFGNEWPIRLLAEMNNLSLTANHGSCQITFPVELHTEGHGYKFRVGAPRIYDTRGNTRSWRARVRHGEVTVKLKRGRIERARALNISHSGISIRTAPDVRTSEGQTIPLVITLPGSRERFAVEGVVVRKWDDDAESGAGLGIQFQGMDRHLEKTLCSYLLRANAAELLQGDGLENDAVHSGR